MQYNNAVERGTGASVLDGGVAYWRASVVCGYHWNLSNEVTFGRLLVCSGLPPLEIETSYTMCVAAYLDWGGWVAVDRATAVTVTYQVNWSWANTYLAELNYNWLQDVLVQTFVNCIQICFD